MLSCVSALRLHGVWTMPATELHIRVTSGTIVRRSPATRLHWTHSPAERGLDHPLVAIAMAVGCLDLRAAVVAVDSAKNQGIVPPSALEAELASSPRGRLVLSHADGASESGLETLVRLALRRRRLRVRSQVAVPGVGRVDLLVGERLVIELDGRTWHTGERFQSDRDRDRLLVSAGYLVLRATYRDVMERLPELEEQVMTLVRRGDHLWRGPHNSSRDVPSSALERGRSPR
jgi:very-short-patch-repair endonuclease